MAVDGDWGHGWQDWGNLSAEILCLVVRKVQERAVEDAAEMRRVVAMAGVCRSWRLTIQSVLAANPFSTTGLLQFPASLREAGPVDKPIQCVMKRKGGHFVLYQSDCGSDQELEESRSNFLMNAMKQWRPGRMMFMLSANRSDRSFSPKSIALQSYMGKLRSNLCGTAFVLWDFWDSSAPGNAGKDEFMDCNSDSTKPRPVTFVKFTEEVINGVSKRKMTCVVRPSRTTPNGGGAGIATATTDLSCYPPQTDNRRLQYGTKSCFPAALIPWSCIPDVKQSVRSVTRSRPRGYVSLRDEAIKENVAENMTNFRPVGVDRDIEGSDVGIRKSHLKGLPGLLKKRGQKVAMFTGSIPEWDVRKRCWSLKFKGRATLPSMHNFQLLMPSPVPGSAAADAGEERKEQSGEGGEQRKGDVDSHQRHGLDQQQAVVMQLGKIGKGSYALEFRSPLSAFQAFNIALSSFATTVGVES